MKNIHIFALEVIVNFYREMYRRFSDEKGRKRNEKKKKETTQPDKVELVGLSESNESSRLSPVHN